MTVRFLCTMYCIRKLEIICSTFRDITLYFFFRAGRGLASNKRNGLKGQIISKGLFGVLEFSQKTNERIRCSSKNEFLHSFFGRIRGYQKSFRNYLTFNLEKKNREHFQRKILISLRLEWWQIKPSKYFYL